MRKSIKKIVSVFTAAAMALAMMVAPSVQAIAADGDVTLYLKLTDSSANTDWAANTWGGAVVDPEAAQKDKPTGWGAGTLPQLAADEAGWAKINVNISAGIGGWQWIKYNPDGSLADQIDCWNSAIASQGLTEAYYDLTSRKWYKEKALTNEIKMAEVSKDMYLIGSGVFGNWGNTTGVETDALKMTADGDTYTITLRKVAAGDYEYKFLQDAPQYKWSYQAGAPNPDEENKPNANFKLKLTELSDVTFSITVTERKGGEDYDKNAMTVFTIADPVVTKPVVLASEIEEAIAAIGTVTLESKAAIEAAETLYAAAPEAEQKKVSNYATLTKARADYDALVAAEEAAGYDVTVHFNNTPNWDGVNLYAFYMVDEATSQDLLGGWPGTAIKADSANTGYYSAGFNLSDEAKAAGKITVIFVNGTGGSGKQTANIDLTLAEDKNEYWISLNGNDTVDDFKNTVLGADATTTAPEGWVASTIEELPDPEVPSDEGEDEGDGEDGEDEDASWDSLKLKIHFLNSEEWEKVGIYLTYGSWAEISGSWPGAEMGLEVSSQTESGYSEEGWYAYGTSGTKEETYNVIFNNMVSDEEVSAGKGVKHQTPDTKDLTTGEYWFVLGDVQAETETQVTYAVNMYTSVEELEEAGYTYDGEGLADFEDAADDEEEDDKKDDAADKDDKTDTQPPMGDAAPVAVMFLGLAAVVAVVASKKRHNA